jgi:hypothetical protein
MGTYDPCSIGRIVHYVSYGSPVSADGYQKYPSVCRAAIVTDIPEMLSEGPNDGTSVGLAVLNPTGMFFDREVPYDEWDSTTALPGAVPQGGSWHWPERV